jgi:hypothetical protein
MRGSSLKIGWLIYKQAGWRDWVKVVVSYLLPIIYKLGITKEQVFSWLEELASRTTKASILESKLPAALKEKLLSVMSEAMVNSGLPSSDFVLEVMKELNEPQPGYRWKKDALGSQRLVRQKGPKSTERPLLRGARFRDKAFVGLWWYTDDSKSRNHRKLQALLRKYGGKVFHREKSGVGFWEYFGGIVVPEDEARSIGSDLYFIAEDFKAEEGDRDYRLSATRLEPLSENKPIHGHDVITLPGIFLSQKYNWELNLPDLINGRSKNSKLNAAVKKLLQDYGK